MSEACILWPKAKKEGVYELDYAHRFCREKAANIGLSLVEYDAGADLKLLRRLLSGFDVVVVVTDPKLVLSSHAVKRLVSNARDKRNALFGPVFGSTAKPAQVAPLPFAYHDFWTFEEVAGIMAEQDHLQEVDELDDACFACACKIITEAAFGSIREVLSSGLKKFVSKGSLVHSFRDVFTSGREDLVEMIPEGVRSLLDVGCAEGRLGSSLMSLRKGIAIDGVEMSPVLAERAKGIYRRVYVGRFEDVKIEEKYDAIVFGDVLEHMYDPWDALAKARELLNPGGVVVGSVPNASHWSIVNQLLMGEFEYIPAGLLCVSHIRFFTLKSLKKHLDSCGFELELVKKLKLPPTPRGRDLIRKLASLGVSDTEILETAEILFRARRI